MKNLTENYSKVVRQINAVRKKQKAVSLGSGFLIFFIVLGGGFLILKILESIFEFDVTGRILLDSVFLIIICLLFGFKILTPLYRLIFRKHFPSDVQIARFIGDHFVSITDKLANAIQVYVDGKNNPQGYSTDLIDLSFAVTYDAVKDFRFADAVSRQPIFKTGRLFGLVLIVYLGLHLVFPWQFSEAQKRLLHPLTSYEAAPQWTIDVSPGNSQVQKNEPVEILAKVDGKNIKKIDLILKEVNNEYQVSHTLLPQKENEFRFLIQQLQDTTEYYFLLEDHCSQHFRLDVVELPLVRNLQIKVIPPIYSRLQTRLLDENVGDINCLKGSIIEMELTSTKKLSQATLVFSEEKKIALNVENYFAQGRWRINESGSYHVQLIDEQKFENCDPIEYQFNIIEDIYPNVFFTFPGQDVDLTEDLILPLTIEAEDDFGFSSVKLGFRISRVESPAHDTTVKYLILPVELGFEEKLSFNYHWDLTPLYLFAGDVVNYFAEVYDNDNVSGPKRARSKTYLARFPTLEEIFAEVETDQQQTYESFEDLYEKSKDLKENVDKLVEELKQNPEMKWEEKKQVEDVLNNQQQLENSLQQVQQQLDEMIERMEKNDLLSLETLEKYAELQKLLEDVMSDELKEAIKKLQQAVEQLDEEQMKQAIERLNFTQEEFLKNIEKTLNILKRLQIEQKLDELVKKAEKLLEEQININEQMNNELLKDQLKELSGDQKETGQKTSDVLSETKNLKQDMGEFANMPDETLEQLLEQARQQGLLQNMESAQQNLQSGNMQQAQQCGQKAQSSLSSMLQLLSQAKKDMIEKQKQEVMSDLMRLSHNFLSLSQQQESLLNSSEKLSGNSPQLTKFADQQKYLLNAAMRNANRMSELSQKTFFVSPQMGRTVGQALRDMGAALDKFEERNINETARNQQKAMVNLNEAVKQLMAAMGELQNANSAAGLDELMEKLSQMSGQQQGINQQTLQMGQGMQSLSLQQQAAMARLAAEQAALRKSMEQLQQEFGERSDVLGRLGQIGEDMKTVTEDLQNRNVSRRTINRQQRILQRLLDAQKSVKKQDYSRKRKAETGKYYRAIGPNGLPVDLGEKNKQIQRDLLRALKEGYSKDYQDLIKKYFETLMKETMNEN